MAATLTAVAVAAVALAALVAARPLDAHPSTVPAEFLGGEVVATAAGSPTASPTGGGEAAATSPASPVAVSTEGVTTAAATHHAVRPDAPWAAAGWVASTAAATGIPETAVRAYADAVLAREADRPGCHLGWTTLAAIGAVESGHGTHGGATVGPDGRPSTPIIGPALDGYGVAAIPATPESTRLHGDPTWDHAVGPLQMIPDTWFRWAADGDGDGLADPQDLDDAALAAAGYLCAGGHDLATGEGWHDAVWAYNHSEDYVRDVLARADGYAQAAP